MFGLIAQRDCGIRLASASTAHFLIFTSSPPSPLFPPGLFSTNSIGASSAEGDQAPGTTINGAAWNTIFFQPIGLLRERIFFHWTLCLVQGPEEEKHGDRGWGQGQNDECIIRVVLRMFEVVWEREGTDIGEGEERHGRGRGSKANMRRRERLVYIGGCSDTERFLKSFNERLDSTTCKGRHRKLKACRIDVETTLVINHRLV